MKTAAPALPPVIRGGQGILLLFGLFLVGLFATSLIAAAYTDASAPSRGAVMATSAIQGVLAFCVPAILAVKLAGFHPGHFLKLDGNLTARAIFGILVLYIVSLPTLNWIVDWNAHIHLPESMARLEQTLRTWEEANGKAGELLLSSTSFGGMVMAVLVVGILTGFCEEIFFRGALQRLLGSCGLRPFWAVTLAALVFSILHFQFFGFVPRLLLGALFGFLLFRSQSLWTAVCAHALNNSMVVVSSWLVNTGMISATPDSVGLPDSGFPWLAAGSAIATVLLLYFFSSMFLDPISETSSGNGKEI